MDDDLQEVKRFRANLAVHDETKADYHRRRFEAERARPTGPARSPRWSTLLGRPRLWGPLTAAVLTLGVIVGVGAVRGAWGPAPAGSDDSILVEAAAELADGESSVAVPSAMQWFYSDTASEQETGYGTDKVESDEEWMRADSKAFADHNDEGQVTTSEIDPAKVGGVFFDLVQTYQFYDQLSDDPKAALDAIYAKLDVGERTRVPGIACSPGCRQMGSHPTWYRDAMAFELIRALLEESTPPDTVQAKLFLAMAEIPGVEDVGTVTDLTGKDVLAVQWREPKESVPDNFAVVERIQILIDPETYRYRGWKWVDIESGEPRYQQLLLDAGIVNQPGQTP